MTQGLPDRINRYILDGSDDDLRRLLEMSQVLAGPARAALHRAGIQPGWRVIECGCGPLGSLALLAELVGPTGRVVGVDFGESAVRRARAVTGALGMDNVEIVQGDIHDVDAEALGGAFDLAYARCFLMHQADPVRTLTRIGQFLRPGGWVVSQEPLRSPAAIAHPPVGALRDYWEIMHRSMEAAGIPRQVVEHLPASARAAGLEVAGMHGFFVPAGPAAALQLHAATLAAIRDRALASGVTTAEEIDGVLSALRAAMDSGHEWVSSPLFLDLTFQNPGALDPVTIHQDPDAPRRSRQPSRRRPARPHA